MAINETLTRGGITKRTGVANDVLTFWLRRGLLRAQPTEHGSGKRLRFDWFEANIAAVLDQVRMLGANVETLAGIAKVFRDAIAWADSLGLDRLGALAVRSFHDERSPDRDIDRVKELELVNQMLRTSENRAPATEEHQRLADQISLEDLNRFVWAYAAIMDDARHAEVEELWFFWRRADGEWCGSYDARAARGEARSALIAVDVPAAIAKVWAEV